MRKKLNLILVTFLLPGVLFAQEQFSKEVAKFDKIIVSPHINLVLTAGDSENVTIEYANVDPSHMNIDVNGSTLHLYLDNARIIPKTEKSDDYNYRSEVYGNAQITAHVTYRHLEGLEIRGDQEVICESPIDAVMFKLKVYGDNYIDLASMDAQVLKVVSYGENEIIIRDGKVHDQKYTLYGTSHVDVSKLSSEFSKAKLYGESELVLHASDQLDVSAFGEPTLTYYGNPALHKNIIVGEAKLFRVA